MGPKLRRSATGKAQTMTIKTVLGVFGVSHFHQDLKSAIDFCETYGAHLTALLVSMGMANWVTYEAAVSTVWIEERQRQIDTPCQES